MDAHEPTTKPDPDQEGESMDDELLPDEFPDKPVGSVAFGVTEAEQMRGESLATKLAREESDDDSPSQRRRRRQRESEDDDAVDLLTDLDEDGRDAVDTLVANRAEADRDEYRTGEDSPRSAEEEAMHVVRGVPGGADRRSVRKDD